MATAPDQVGEVVQQFFTKWFKSRVSVEERWGSWENMMEVNPKHAQEEYQEFIKECYLEPMVKNTEQAERSGTWDNILQDITMKELEAAIHKTKRRVRPAGANRVCA